MFAYVLPLSEIENINLHEKNPHNNKHPLNCWAVITIKQAYVWTGKKECNQHDKVYVFLLSVFSG